ncbi:class I SAM-dependent DNA methyltransferase [Nocardioides sp. T2.26MG-1]|uniref:class I SAM-dependent DNA methyltransferase n=1 Tax=Nocardioides sp. T2.26MG-1 TaxID=3041166 RepID=UPI002477C42D|nr:N-6 DNA methylase [Nocardioides sp. T2.26MG-1]CAI9410007.1 putative type I restriction enzymeP M protein [Nocardioides sp. T2.26MG-1]
MRTDFKPVIDELWAAFEEIGIEDGYDIVAQATLLLAVRRLDVIHTAAEKKARLTGRPIESPIFDAETEELRWSRLKNVEGSTMFGLFETKVVQFLRERGGTFTDVVFTIPSPSALSRLVDLIDKVPYLSPADNGAVYEYLISKITTKNSSGGFPTPRHLVDLMVRLVDPQPGDLIADPASGSGGFLAYTASYLRERNPGLLLDETKRAHFQHRLLHGFDNDPAFARMSTMNLLLHGVETPDVRRRDSLTAMTGDVGRYSLVLTNPPFNGSVEKSALDKDLYRDVKSTTKAPLFAGRVLSLLQAGGRAAVILPEGMLFGAQKAQLALRKALVDEHKLHAVIKVPPAAYEPFSATQTAILIFTKTGIGGTDRVWFYDIRADGRSLDKRRMPVAENDLPDVLARWKTRDDPGGPELSRERSDQSFFVSREEIAANDYLLTLSRYREIPEDAAPTRPPREVLDDIKSLNAEIEAGIAELERLL